MNFWNLILDIDKHLQYFISEYNYWVYLILFLLIFIKTGIGFLSFIPGETLLVATGIMTSNKYLEPHFCLILLSIASILGSILNYILGKYLGTKILHFKFRKQNIIKVKHLEKTQMFYQKHGAKTLILVRFIPMFRSLAPFIAGMSQMNFAKFFIYSIIGWFIWITTYLYVGYFFGNVFS